MRKKIIMPHKSLIILNYKFSTLEEYYIDEKKTQNFFFFRFISFSFFFIIVFYKSVLKVFIYRLICIIFAHIERLNNSHRT